MDITLGMAAMLYKSSLDIIWQQAAIHIHKVQAKEGEELLCRCLFY